MPGEVVREVLTSLEREIPDMANLRLVDARIGLGYTGVKLSAGHVGVCHTLTDETACCQRIDRAGTLSGSPALEIAKLSNSWKLGEAIVGIATINALSSILLERHGGRYSIIEDTDCIDQIGIKKDDTVALVGYIKPFVSVSRVWLRTSM